MSDHDSHDVPGLEEGPDLDGGPDLEWPERWSSASDAPPGARDFLSSVDRPRFAPPEIRHLPPPRPAPRFFGPTLAVAVVLGGVLIWQLAPRASGPPPLVSIASDPREVPSEVAHTNTSTGVEDSASDVVPLDAGPPDVGVPDVSLTDAGDPARWLARRSEDAVPDAVPGPEAVEGMLEVSTSPSADIYVDGLLIGTSPILRLALPAGRHVVRAFDAELGIDQSTTVTVRAAETSRLRMSLEPSRRNRPPTDEPDPLVAEHERSRYDGARACAISGDHACVIRELRGHCTAAREYEILIASMRAQHGYDRDVEALMRTYLSRFPSGRQASQYRVYLIEHGARGE
jgi:hypothetical protein